MTASLEYFELATLVNDIVNRDSLTVGPFDIPVTVRRPRTWCCQPCGGEWTTDR